MMGRYQSTGATVSFARVQRYFKCRVIDPSADPTPGLHGHRVTVPGWSWRAVMGAGQAKGIAIVWTAPRGNTTISLPSHCVGASAALAWIDAGAPPSETRSTEKQIVREAETPVYYPFLHRLSLSPTGMPCAAAARFREGGSFVWL